MAVRRRQPGRLLLFATTVIAIVLIIVGAALSIQRHDSERAALLAGVAREAEVVAARFDQLLEERFEALQTIAQVQLVQDGTPAEVKAWFEQLVEQGSSFTGGLSLISTDGMLILLSGYPLDEPPIDLSDRDYVRAVLTTGRPAFGDAIIGRRSGDPLLTFAVPVLADTGAMVAILAGTIRLDLPEGGIAQIGASSPDAIIVDASGQLVLDRGVVTAPVRATDTFRSYLEGASRAVADLTGPHGNGRWLGGIAPVAGSGWWAAVLHDREATLGPIERSRALEIAIVVLLGLAIAAAGAVMGGRLDRDADTDRRAAEAVVAREAFLHEFADALPVIAGTLDEELHTSFANRALAERPGADLVSLVDADDRHLFPRPGSQEATIAIDVRLAEPGGSPDDRRWHRIQMVRAPKAGWFFAAADIDDQKRAELGLQRDVAQRDEFLGLVSHELRTPLTVIIGTAVTLPRLTSDALPDAVRGGIAEIEASARQLQGLLDNMLTLSRAAATVDEAPIEPQVPARLIERAVTTFRRSHPELAVSVEAPADLPIVAANDSFTDQVLWNLLTNAAKYGAGSAVEVIARERPGFVEIAVSDGGPGVPPDMVDRLFEPHFRSSAGRGTAPGLGLGLTVCRRLVELQGGSITARRGDVRGMTFAFTLPILDE